MALSAVRWMGRLVLVLAGVLAMAWALQHDAPRVSANHTEIYVSDSYTTAHRIDGDVLMIGGQARSYYVWAVNVDNSTGASAFEVDIAWNPAIATLQTLLPRPNWLASTGRSPICDEPQIDGINGTALGSCNTFLPPPPYGPHCPGQCNGWIATLIINPGSTKGSTTFNLAGSELVDTPPNPDNITPIPAVVRSLGVTVAPCADFPPSQDGTVRVADILWVVNRYRSTLPQDQPADLDGSGLINVQDILVAAKQFFQDCPT